MDDQTRSRVLDAAEPMFGERGFFRVTLEEVAKNADVDPAELQAEFGDSGRLLVKLAQVRAHELRSVLHQAVEGLSSRSMIEGSGFRAWFEWIGDHPHIYRIVRQSELVDQEVFRNWYRDLADDYVRGLTRAMDEGEVQRSDPETLTWCLMGMGDFLGMRYVLWDGRRELPRDVMQTFLRIMTRILTGR
jgi:AcrR family transcriptional regulator